MKIIIIAIVAAIVFLSGCGQRVESVDTAADNKPAKDEYLLAAIDELRAQIEADSNTINEMLAQLEADSGTIRELERLAEYYQFKAAILEDSMLSWPFPYRLAVWPPERIRLNLIEYSTNLPWYELFGTGPAEQGIFHPCAVFIGSGYVTARVQRESDGSGEQCWWQPDVILTFSVIDEYHLHWEIVGYFFPWASKLGVVPENWQNRRRHISYAEIVTVQIHSASIATGYFEETYYVEEISGEKLWEETIRLKRLHTGIEISDFWYEGRRIIVDIKPNQWPRLTFGTQSFCLGVRVVLLTFASFPDVDEIEVLFGGLRPSALDHHGSFYGYYRVGVGFPESSISYATPIVTRED